MKQSAPDDNLLILNNSPGISPTYNVITGNVGKRAGELRFRGLAPGAIDVVFKVNDTLKANLLRYIRI